jgi:hypothetical protein
MAKKGKKKTKAEKRMKKMAKFHTEQSEMGTIYCGGVNHISKVIDHDAPIHAKKVLANEPVKDMDLWMNSIRGLLKDDGVFCIIGN